MQRGERVKLSSVIIARLLCGSQVIPCYQPNKWQKKQFFIVSWLQFTFSQIMHILMTENPPSGPRGPTLYVMFYSERICGAAEELSKSWQRQNAANHRRDQLKKLPPVSHSRFVFPDWIFLPNNLVLNSECFVGASQKAEKRFATLQFQCAQKINKSQLAYNVYA